MAAIPKSLAENGRRSSSSSGRANLSHGRGGAGNIGTTPSDFEAPTLETPTLKSDIYTTGRGGSGNMAKNNDPEAARRAQDVVASPRRLSSKAEHVGRGGAANVFKPSDPSLPPSSLHQQQNQGGGDWENALDDTSSSYHGEKREETRREREGEKGLADRGKEWLGRVVGGGRK